MSDAVYLLSCLAAIILFMGISQIYKKRTVDEEHQSNKLPGLIIIIVSILIAAYLMFV